MATTYLARLRKMVWAHAGKGTRASAQDRAPARSRGAARSNLSGGRQPPVTLSGGHILVKPVSDTLTTAHGRSQQGVCGEGAPVLFLFGLTQSTVYGSLQARGPFAHLREQTFLEEPIWRVELRP